MEEQGEGEVYSSSLLEQTKNRLGRFGRGSERPRDVVTIVNRMITRRGMAIASRAQIEKVLESCPNVFPESWQAPLGKIALSPNRLPQAERERYLRSCKV